MENDGLDMSASNGGGPAGSRWNPTKEQIELLETLYRQGIRTPSAEQIQQITAKLRAFGHIEGKNVFYWFQNHKARQRQKQKQESIAHFNRFLHRPPTIPYPTWPNVACPPYYMAPTDIVYRQHCPKVLLPGCYKRKPMLDNNTKAWNGVTIQDPRYHHQEHNIMMSTSSHGINEEFINAKNFNQETLDLFPVHPTGNLQAKRSIDQTSTAAAAAVASTSSHDNHMIEKGNFGEHQFIDFFSGDGLFDGSSH